MKKKCILLLLLLSFTSYAQTDIEKVLSGGAILINGLSFLKTNKSETKDTNSKVINSVCIKNKLQDKIIFIITGKDSEDDTVKKELVIQKDGKECVFDIQKGVYTYEIMLSNKEVFKKGEYKFTEDITITVKTE